MGPTAPVPSTVTRSDSQTLSDLSYSTSLRLSWIMEIYIVKWGPDAEGCFQPCTWSFHSRSARLTRAPHSPCTVFSWLMFSAPVCRNQVSMSQGCLALGISAKWNRTGGQSSGTHWNIIMTFSNFIQSHWQGVDVGLVMGKYFLFPFSYARDSHFLLLCPRVRFKPFCMIKEDRIWVLFIAKKRLRTGHLFSIHLTRSWINSESPSR
jgi:hypothetical protein